MISDFYDYIYYRIYGAFYQLELKQNEFLKFNSSPEPDKDRLTLYCAFYISAIISMNVMSLLLLFYLLFESSLPRYYFLSNSVIPALLVIVCSIFYLFYYDKTLYNRLKKHYKKENKKSIKGWFVFGYVCFSVIIFFKILDYYLSIC